MVNDSLICIIITNSLVVQMKVLMARRPLDLFCSSGDHTGTLYQIYRIEKNTVKTKIFYLKLKKKLKKLKPNWQLFFLYSFDVKKTPVSFKTKIFTDLILILANKLLVPVNVPTNKLVDK
ncbi:hypothetical protein BpHYR1_003149 [Brachionus plicatilis]|uniref:Uncharacterized protein n=1 Tax=Brachionus plicatilis TaxID=10195 RepID=A0A3M7QAB8_BRAPC|nr:hypothetical protein BpHYR1_003149 [Brachionus plicatilis]